MAKKAYGKKLKSVDEKFLQMEKQCYDSNVLDFDLKK